MDYKVLYRKYRPLTFDEISGQSSTINLLKESIIEGKISHAYIFSGPRGTGKTSTAKIFARAINCLNNKDGNPCNKCDNCKSFNTSSDIYEIDAASNNGVDQVREIIENIKLSPINSKYKVYIIDEVHMLSTSAFNALLLTLEEPPSHVVFILATTDIEDVPITVLSRCQRLDFKKISDADIIATLSKIAEKEQIEISNEALKEIAEASEGGLRDALSILDQLSKLDVRITQEIVLNSIGLISTQKVDELISFIEQSEVDKIVDFVRELSDIAADFKSVVKKIISNLKLHAVNALKSESSSRLTYEDYKNLCFDLAGLLYKNNVNVDSYSLLELTLLNYVENTKCENSNDRVLENSPLKKDTKDVKTTVSIEEYSKIDSKESKNSINELPDENIYQKLIKVRINNCFVNANKEYLIKNRELWQEFMQDVPNKKIKGLVSDTNIVLASDTIIVISAEFSEKVFNINENLDIISEQYNNFTSQNYKFIAVQATEWEKETKIYKENIQKKFVYEMMDEPDITKKDSIDDIFSRQKIEIQ